MITSSIPLWIPATKYIWHNVGQGCYWMQFGLGGDACRRNFCFLWSWRQVLGSLRQVCACCCWFCRCYIRLHRQEYSTEHSCDPAPSISGLMLARGLSAISPIDEGDGPGYLILSYDSEKTAKKCVAVHDVFPSNFCNSWWFSINCNDSGLYIGIIIIFASLIFCYKFIKTIWVTSIAKSH